MSFKCGYIYPRVEDYELKSIVESEAKALVLGVKGSGVSSALERAIKLSNRKVELLHNHNDALKKCSEAYVVADVSVWEALELTRICGKILAGGSGGLIDIIKASIQAPRDVKLVVLKPLSRRELEDYVKSFNTIITSPLIIEELLTRTGGMPGDVCRFIMENELIGRALTMKDLEKTPEKPSWLSEAENFLGSALFEKLAAHTVLGFIPKDFQEMLCGECWWLVEDEYGFRVPGDFLWLQPFMVRFLGKEKVVNILSKALNYELNPIFKFSHTSLLYRFTGDPSYGVEALNSAREVLRQISDQHVKFNVAVEASSIASKLGDHSNHIVMLKEAVINMPPQYQLTPIDVFRIVGEAKRSSSHLDDAGDYVELLKTLGSRLLAQRMMEEAETVISELEKLVWEEKRLNVRLKAETAYATLLAYKSALLGQWREAARTLAEVSERGLDSGSYVMLAIAASFISSKEPLSVKAENALRKAIERGLVGFDDARFIDYTLKFMKGGLKDVLLIAEEPLEDSDYRVKLVKLLTKIAVKGPIDERVIGGVMGQGSPASLVKALNYIVKGDNKSLIEELRLIPESEEAHSPLSLIADIMLNTGLSINRRDELKRIAGHLTILADSLKSSGHVELGRMIEILAQHARSADKLQVKLALARLIFYTLNTYL
ncbi:MAG: hypothetical protein P3X22_006995 [Thermoprotei archaeon]|nr:hypothetical protein [Thermoprotei archaeon]